MQEESDRLFDSDRDLSDAETMNQTAVTTAKVKTAIRMKQMQPLSATMIEVTMSLVLRLNPAKRYFYGKKRKKWATRVPASSRTSNIVSHLSRLYGPARINKPTTPSEDFKLLIEEPMLDQIIV